MPPATEKAAIASIEQFLQGLVLALVEIAVAMIVPELGFLYCLTDAELGTLACRGK